MERSLEERNKLVEANLKLVYHVAKKLEPYAKRQNFAGNLDDLASIGMLGLIKAATNFDESRGVKFSTFAYINIRNGILKQVKGNGLIKIPEYAHGGKQFRYYQMCRCRSKKKWLEKCQAASRVFNILSLSAPQSNIHLTYNLSDGAEYGEMDPGWNDPPAPEHEDSVVLSEVYDVVMTQLKETYRVALIKKFWGYQQEKDIAEELGLTRQRVNVQIHSGLKKLREIYGVGEDDA